MKIKIPILSEERYEKVIEYVRSNRSIHHGSNVIRVYSGGTQHEHGRGEYIDVVIKVKSDYKPHQAEDRKKAGEISRGLMSIIYNL